MSEDDDAASTTAVTSPGPQGQERPLLIGATAADPRNVVVIWNAMRRWLTEHGMPVEYALFSTYDAMGRALLDGMIDVAWNAPMAHAQSLMTSGGACRTLAMRDTDQDVAAVIIALTSSGITSVEDLRGRTLAVGVANSTELRLIPAHQLRAQGFDPDDVTVAWRSEPFCHCAFTARPGLPEAVSTRFVELLTAMDPADPSIAEMMRLEHLTRWLPATDDGWSSVIDAIRAADLEGATFI